MSWSFRLCRLDFRFFMPQRPPFLPKNAKPGYDFDVKEAFGGISKENWREISRTHVQKRQVMSCPTPLA